MDTKESLTKELFDAVQQMIDEAQIRAFNLGVDAAAEVAILHGATMVAAWIRRLKKA